MVERIEFGSRKSANIVRDKIEEYRHRTDDKRTKTVVLKDSAPESVVRRVRNDAFASRRDETGDSAGMAELTTQERESLKRQHRTFQWQKHGFEAMRVKASLTREGVTEWMDFYEPGEGVNSALSKLREAKGSAQQSRASIGVEGMRTDREEVSNTGRRAKQTAKVQAQQIKSAKAPAIVDTDPDAVDFLETQRRFDDDIFDIAFSRTDTFGRARATGPDIGLVEERHEQRSERAQELDEQKHATITRDPLQWAQNPAQFDFPGVDTLQPEKKHQSRPEKAQERDENERAPVADDPATWAQAMDEYDLPGVDLPGTLPTPGGGEPTTDGGDSNPVPENPLMSDDRPQQQSLDVADPTQHRESRTAVEQSEGGLFEDTRSDPDRGPDMGDAMEGRQEELGEMMGMDNEPDMSDFMP